ncbi:MAG: hypothetical protein H6563_05590 [Lewinellaceae bacterium]|nr:hypothetical protein [Lewinellaceae bacterium]
MKKWNILLSLTLITGAALRIAVFFQNRSLFLDEANLARNIAQRDLSALLQPLDYGQFAPPLFLLATKWNTLLLGNTEYALRLLPLLAGLASLFLFYRITTGLIPSFPARWLAVWIFSFHTTLLRYATECKQYGIDVFAAVLVLWLALRQGERPFQWKQAIIWTFLGMVICWLSMPVVFILSGVGIYWIYVFWKKNDRASLGRVAVSIAGWLLSFGLFFFFFLRSDAEGDYLQNYHQPYFLPLLPASAAEWKQWGGLLFQLLKGFSGSTAAAQVVGGLGLLGAWIGWGRARKGMVLLWSLPVLSCLIASGFHYYSLLPRLTLFLTPLLILTAAYGWHVWWEKSGKWPRVAILAGLVLMGSRHTGFRFFTRPYLVEDLKGALAFLEANQHANEGLYVWKWAVPGVDFYTRLYAHPYSLKFGETVNSDQHFAEELARICDHTPPNGRVWLLYNHLMSKETRQEMKEELDQFRQRGLVEEAFQAKNVAVWSWRPQNKADNASANTSAEGG